MASAELEAFVDELLRQARAKGYAPTVFVGMRARKGTVAAMSELVQTGDLQSGFKRLKDLGLLDWSIEAGVLTFPDEFSAQVRDCAAFRLKLAAKPAGRRVQPAPD